MRTAKTFSVLFWVYTQRSDKNNSSNIYARITLNGKKVNLSLNQKVNVDSWDPKRQKLKGNGKTSREVNYYLDEVKAIIVQSYRDLVNESKLVTPQLIKARYLGEDTRNHTLKNIFSYHNDNLGVNLAPKTLCHYKTSQKYLLKFLEAEYRKSDIFLCDLDYSFILGFERFLRSYFFSEMQGNVLNGL
ncbi:phage integrase SAM-like domain-containing protein [Maribacter chungangensis]|uniref:Phage integrase SAM-like domain-containing protein n=1 Tax=Maribacter chungangensis TaxID=1069117 RepID=A0ABW3B0N1_9FLAO